MDTDDGVGFGFNIGDVYRTGLSRRDASWQLSSELLGERFGGVARGREELGSMLSWEGGWVIGVEVMTFAKVSSRRMLVVERSISGVWGSGRK